MAKVSIVANIERVIELDEKVLEKLGNEIPKDAESLDELMAESVGYEDHFKDAKLLSVVMSGEEFSNRDE